MQTLRRRLPPIHNCKQPGRPPETPAGPQELGTVAIQLGYALQRIKVLYDVNPPSQSSLNTYACIIRIIIQFINDAFAMALINISCQ